MRGAKSGAKAPVESETRADTDTGSDLQRGDGQPSERRDKED